jgi:beta-galactosidase beta subunit
MITDNIKNISLYSGISERIVRALKYVSENNLSEMNPVDYEIYGKNIINKVGG